MNHEHEAAGRGTYDPALCSVIFAPSAQNFTAISIGISENIAERVLFESLLNSDEFVRRRLFENIQRAEPMLRSLFIGYLSEYLETASTSVTAKLPTETVLPTYEQVPPRRFPFMSHFDLLALPSVEGAFFDPDDFDES